MLGTYLLRDARRTVISLSAVVFGVLVVGAAIVTTRRMEDGYLQI